MTIGIFVEYNNQVVQLPVNPSSLKRVKDSNNNTTEIVELGEINRLGIANLSECVVESFFPIHSHHSFVQTSGNFRGPTFYIDFFEQIRNDRRPCRLIVTDTQINMLASIEAFDFEYRAGEIGDVYFRLDFKEFRNHAAREIRVDLTGQIPSGTPRPTPTPQKPSPSPQITVGSTVIVNGRLHRDSFGAGPGLTERNAVRKVNFHRPGRSYPFHVTLTNGNWRGWVQASAVRLQ